MGKKLQRYQLQGYLGISCSGLIWLVSFLVEVGQLQQSNADLDVPDAVGLPEALHRVLKENNKNKCLNLVSNGT